MTALLVSAALAGLPTHARDYQKGTLKIEQPWSRVTPGGAKVAGGYLKITNTGSEPDRLVSVTTPIAGVGELHEMKMEDGVMRMRAIGNGLEIPAGGTVELKPGGLHVMFIDLKAPIEKNKPFAARLVFEKAGPIEVEFHIESMGAKEPAGHHKH
jgi:periplasmic copper chaperone A